MKALAMMLLALLAMPAGADESVPVCFNYGCYAERPVLLSDGQLRVARDLLAGATSPEAERNLLAQVVARLYRWSAEQTPIGADRGGNLADEGRPGSMDCIDHSRTTDRFLRLLERRGWLRFHRVKPVVVRHRWIIGQHFTAVIEEAATGISFAVDSWFVDNGEPPVVLPLEEWRQGGGPDV